MCRSGCNPAAHRVQQPWCVKLIQKPSRPAPPGVTCAVGVKQNLANSWAAWRAAAGLESRTASTWSAGLSAGRTGRRRLVDQGRAGADECWAGCVLRPVRALFAHCGAAPQHSPAPGGRRCARWATAPRRAGPCRCRRPGGRGGRRWGQAGIGGGGLRAGHLLPNVREGTSQPPFAAWCGAPGLSAPPRSRT
jgi:hypothetical protein